MDNEEAGRISGTRNIVDAINYFKKNNSAFIITRGSDTSVFFSNGILFTKVLGELPVSKMVSNKIKDDQYRGDTTGCGDNFAGGVIASIATQMHNKVPDYNLKEAVVLGICSGGFTCSYAGGTYFENGAYEKKQKIESLFTAYQYQ